MQLTITLNVAVLIYVVWLETLALAFYENLNLKKAENRLPTRNDKEYFYEDSSLRLFFNRKSWRHKFLC